MANATIDGKECTLFLDYDCANGVLSTLSDDGKIDWLEQRMNMIFLNPMRKIVPRTSPIFTQLEHPPGQPPMTAMLLAVSLLMNTMEAMGSFLVGILSTNKMRFHAFVRKYMLDWTVSVTAAAHGTKPLADILWKSYRNGLAHSFAIKHAGIEHILGPNKYHISHGVLQIDAWKLFDDFESAVIKMFHDVRTDASAKQLFLNRFNAEYKC